MIRSETPKTVDLYRTLANHVSSFVFQDLFSGVEPFILLFIHVNCSEHKFRFRNDHTNMSTLCCANTACGLPSLT